MQEIAKGVDKNRDAWFIRLVEQYQTALLRLCYVALRDYALAEDAVQETFLKAYQSSNKFCQQCSEKTWLMKIAMNTCRDFKRLAWFRRVDRRITPEQLPEKFVAFEQKQDDTLQSIMRLPFKDKEVLLLYYYQDMTLVEIGQAIDLSTSAVHARLMRAKKKLRGVLKGGEDRA